MDTTPDRMPQAGLSLVSGATEPPLLDATVFATLGQAAARWPQAEAAVFVQAGVRWTWAQFLREVLACAAGLQRLGVRQGDRVGIWAPNRPEWLITQFATARLGAILVNINPAYRLAELEYALNKAGVSVLVTAASFKTSDYLDMLQALGVGRPQQAQRLPQLRQVLRMGTEASEGMRNWDALMAEGHAALAAGWTLPDEAELHARQPINI